MKVDSAKRRRVMQRSQKLGHCICDPRRPCPCDVFTDQGICPCAGERPQTLDASAIKLTRLVRNAGCASKIAPADLEAVLSRLPRVDDPAVLSGIPAGDDAGIYALSDGVTLVQTVDVFTPCVDDPYAFGRICAANCLSDIYAMGAVPRTALSILGFPTETLDPQIMYHMLKGAMDVLAEAHVALIGGHSIKDEEIKLGFAITGTIEPGQAVQHGTARVGDVLVLTKPLGVGVLGFARQIGRGEGDFAAAEESMGTLNKAAAEAMTEVGVSACTDVTGFGLFGHLIGMARHSGVTAEVYADALPAFDGVIQLLRDGVVSGAAERNREYLADDLSVADGVEEALVDLGLDAQTSGGLLIAVPEVRCSLLMQALTRRGVKGAVVGRIVEESDGEIRLTRCERVTGETPQVALRTSPGRADLGAPQATGTPAAPTFAPPGSESQTAQAAPCCREAQVLQPAREQAPSEPCCAESSGPSREHQEGPQAAPGGGAPEGTSALAAQAFGMMMRVTAAPGAIDARTKELIHFALAVASRCGPCVSAHLEKARGMGITRRELDEAAWCSVAMGGAPVRMFYTEALENLGRGKGCCS